MSKARLEAAGKTVEYQEVFLESIEHVYDKEVDIVLGNHPFHNDTFDKHEQTEATGVNAFVDPTEWHRMLDELKDLYLQFIEDDRNGVKRAGHKSHFLKFRDICTPYLQRPDELDRELIDFYKYYGSKAPERP